MNKKRLLLIIYWCLAGIIILYGTISIIKFGGFSFFLRASFPFLLLLGIIFIGVPIFYAVSGLIVKSKERRAKK